MPSTTIGLRRATGGLHDGDDATPDRAPVVEAKRNRSTTPGRRLLSDVRLVAAPVAKRIAQQAFDKVGHASIAASLGVSEQTVYDWTNKESPLAFTLRDVIATGEPDVIESIGDQLKTVAADRRAMAALAKNRARPDFHTLTREMLALFAVAGEASRRLQESSDPESPAGRGVSQSEKDGIVESLEELKTNIEQLLEIARQLPVEH